MHSLSALILVACSHGPPPILRNTSGAATTQNARCADVADRILAVVVAGAADGDKDYYQQRYRDLYARRCTEDHWSDAAIKCFLSPHHPGDDTPPAFVNSACNHLLTARQLDMIECVDDAAVTSGKPPSAATERAAIESKCQREP